MMKLQLILPLFLVLLVGCAQNITVAEPTENVPEQVSEIYSPQINPADFVSAVTNKYFFLKPGRKFVYAGESEDGVERIEVYVTKQTKEVLGVATTVVWDRVWLNDELIEDTKDWYAQDREGNVWYFGEDTKELVDNTVTSTAGSWEAGNDGAKPGIIIKANPQVGDVYRQEYYKGKAEDMAEVLALKETATVPAGTFTDCIKTKDWNLLEPGGEEHKYYCSEVGGVVLEIGLEDNEKVELIEITEESGAEEPQEKGATAEELKSEVTEENAKEIAVKRVPGKVTDFSIEKKFGKLAYVVEIRPNSGPETDVIIDIATGEVLGIET